MSLTDQDHQQACPRRLGKGSSAGLAVLLWMALALMPKAWAEPVTVDAQGVGVTREEAVAKALMSAVEQVSGVKIEGGSLMQKELIASSTAESRSVELNELQQTEIRRQANGIVKTYAIQSIDDQTPNSIKAFLSVTIERYAPPGLPTQDRRRIYTVLPIDLSRKATSHAALLMDKLNAYLVQSRRFAVLDRGNLGVYEKELDLLKSDQVPLAETVRIGQVIGTDYIVIPKIRKFEQTETVETIQLTGQKITRLISLFNIDYVLVDVATRQIRWTGKVDKKQSTGLDPSQTAMTQVSKSVILDALLGEAVDELGESILNAIYPLRVTQVLDGGMVVINQGGDTLKPKQVLTAMKLGEQIIDPYTKEPLGQAETPVAEIVIDRVDPKLSYGRVVSGKVGVSDEYILRKSRSAAAAQASQPAAPPPKQDKLKW